MPRKLGRYAPPDLCKAERTAIRGIEDLFTFDNLCAAAALHIGVYNFVRVHQTLSCTPAMAAGVCDTLYSLEQFYDLVLDHAKMMKKRANTRRLIERLNRGE